MDFRVLFVLIFCVVSFTEVFGQFETFGIRNDGDSVYEAFEAPRLIIVPIKKSKMLSRYGFVRKGRFSRRLKQIQFEE